MKKQAIKQKGNPFLDQIVDDLHSLASRELQPREPGFASDPRCKLDNAGRIFTAIAMLVDTSDELARLAEEVIMLRAGAEAARKNAAKLQSKVWELETAARTIGKTKPAPATKHPVGPLVIGAKCKHKEWDTSTTPPTCKACGKEKSARGRKNADPAANVATAIVDGVAKIDPPSLPLPLPPKNKGKGLTAELADGRVVDLQEEDEFAGGTVGRQ